MRKLIPYPLLTIGLALMWLLLTSFPPGSFVLAILVSIGSSHALHTLGEASPKIGRWLAMPQLFFIVLFDIVRSNIAVAGLILTQSRNRRRSGFIVVPTRLKDPSALGILAIVLTSTPGTAWLDYSSTRGEVLIHVFDLVDDAEWIHLIANRYERLLLEIFK